MKRRKFLICAAALVAVAVLAGGCEIHLGDGVFRHGKKRQEVTRRYKHLAPFERLNIGALCQVTFVQGDSLQVTASGRKVAIDELQVTSAHGELNIDYQPMSKFTRLSDPGSVSVVVTAPDLVGVDLRGAGSFRIEGPLDTDTLVLMLNGVGAITTEGLLCDCLNADLRGTGTMQLGPVSTQRASIQLRGVGTVNASFERAARVEARLKGAGAIRLDGSIDRLQKDVRGTGSITGPGETE